MTWIIRTYRTGDEDVQAAIYNEAAANLPQFKPATPAEISRRTIGPDFDPTTRLYAEDATGHVGGYVQFQACGRVSMPWCRRGCESAAEPLFAAALAELRRRGVGQIFAAYRPDWTPVFDFLARHDFRHVRDMWNYVLPLSDMPTRMARPRQGMALRRQDVPELFTLAPHVLASRSTAELEHHLFANPYFPPESAFVLRRRDESPIAVGVLVWDMAYADPRQVDASMPCFRLGAFGTEGMSVKRIRGLFSFLTRDCPEAMQHGLTLLEHAAGLVERRNGDVVAAQVPSDAPHLARFYEAYFIRQGGFPVWELPVVPLAV
jgi:hypothetical protein